jgi:hypothetical protein
MSAPDRMGHGMDTELFELLGYLLTSARGLLDEPPEYGPLRLLEGASRLCAAMERGGSVEADALKGIREGIDGGKFSILADPAAFAATIDRAVTDYTLHLAQRGV